MRNRLENAIRGVFGLSAKGKIESGVEMPIDEHTKLIQLNAFALDRREGIAEAAEYLDWSYGDKLYPNRVLVVVPGPFRLTEQLADLSQRILDNDYLGRNDLFAQISEEILDSVKESGLTSVKEELKLFLKGEEIPPQSPTGPADRGILLSDAVGGFRVANPGDIIMPYAGVVNAVFLKAALSMHNIRAEVINPAKFTPSIGEWPLDAKDKLAQEQIKNSFAKRKMVLISPSPLTSRVIKRFEPQGR